MDAKLALTVSSKEPHKHIPLLKTNSSQPRSHTQVKAGLLHRLSLDGKHSSLVLEPKNNVVWLLRKEG